MKKREVLVFVLFSLIFIGILSLLNLNLVSASFTKGNLSQSIEKQYGPGGVLRGWINISLQQEPADSLLSVFDGASSITLIDFLDDVGADYDCVPEDCESDYSTSGQATSKTFSLDVGKSKIVGLKIKENTEISEISSFSLKVSSNAGASGYPQLFIDLLNDKEKEWQAYNSSDNFGGEIYGCYSPSGTKAEITQTQYCEKIIIPLAPKVKIGAEVQEVAGRGGNVDFKMELYDKQYSYQGSCTASVSVSGKISCTLSNFKTDKQQDFFVCISTKNSLDNNKYTIGYEQTETCGFTGEFNNEYTHDFDLFARAGKYSEVGSFLLNNNEIAKCGINPVNIEDYIEDYIYSRYSNNCSAGCVIPIKFSSMMNQQINLSAASLSYVAGISKTTNDIYELQEQDAKINMDFQKLNLELSNLSVPDSYGDKTLILKLNNETIAEEKIEVTRVPIINYVAPAELPSSISVKFIVHASGGNITIYSWDFGDGTAEQFTDTNQIYHTYSSVGTFLLRVTATNEIGTATKSFSIKVKSPEEMINVTLAEKRERLNNTLKKIESMSEWYKPILEKRANLDSINADLKSLERKYEIASTSSEYVAIMANLTQLDVPSSVGVSESSSGEHILDPEQINPGYLIEIGAGDVANPENYKTPIAAWFGENIEMQIERKVYGLYFDERIEDLATLIKLKIKPKKDFDRETYLIIEKSYDELSFKENYNEKSAGQATAITFSSLISGQEREIEFIVTERIGFGALPVYVSPEFSLLPEQGTVGICNFNGKCEKDKGETWRNCRNDCKPWGRTMLYIFLLLLGVFVVYIILQEWYKRHYEGRLFKNRNDLFNLVNFISNALNQGITKEEIIEKLRKSGWNKEQIIYAFKKVKGERTGMWEIPIFRFWEKRKIEKEIEKRKSQQFQQAPRNIGSGG